MTPISDPPAAGAARSRLLLPAGAALAAGLALAAVLAVHSWLGARDARIRLEATMDAQRQLITAAERREQQRARELRDALAQIAAVKRGVASPQQIIRELPKYLPLPQPIELATTSVHSEPRRGESAHGEPIHRESAQLEPSSGEPIHSEPAQREPVDATSAQGEHTHGEPVQGEAARRETIHGESVAQMPLEDLKPLFDFVQDCRACKLRLDATQADLADEHAKITALKQQRDMALRAVRGGGFWSRVKHGAKWFVLGGAVGAAAVAASR